MSRHKDDEQSHERGHFTMARWIMMFLECDEDEFGQFVMSRVKTFLELLTEGELCDARLFIENYLMQKKRLRLEFEMEQQQVVYRTSLISVEQMRKDLAEYIRSRTESMFEKSPIGCLTLESHGMN
jgi:hypothetical protein